MRQAVAVCLPPLRRREVRRLYVREETPGDSGIRRIGCRMAGGEPWGVIQDSREESTRLDLLRSSGGLGGDEK